jgi:GTP-binding protein Era
MQFGYASLIGRPNAGKSTLLNRIIGTKLAIVSDKPQTTRTRILGVKNYPTGQIVLLDTPGVHRPLHRMNVQMVEAALGTIRQVDVLMLVVDASQRTGRGDRFLLQRLAEVTKPIVLVPSKIDAIDKRQLLPLIDWYRGQRAFASVVPVSALTGENEPQLEQVLLDLMPSGEPMYPPDFLTDQPERFFAAEIVREKVLRTTHDELPFTTAVTVDRFEERPGDAPLAIYCSILVEQASQKPIIIGRGGALIKRIGIEAREELERFFGARVFLDLHVKVRPRWREDPRWLGAIGLGRDRR